MDEKEAKNSGSQSVSTDWLDALADAFDAESDSVERELDNPHGIEAAHDVEMRASILADIARALSRASNVPNSDAAGGSRK